MNILDILLAILYGIVEGITEWLPVSSTGHMIILEDFLHFQNISEDFFELFLVVIQLGAILAVILSFFTKLFPFGKSKPKEEKKEIWRTWGLILIACLPAAIIGLIFDDLLDQYLYNKLTVSITLIIYGILFIVIEYFTSKKQINYEEVRNFSWKTALIIGGAQVLALIPGTSRSGVTILAALLIGCSRSSACEFSFYLSIPVMFGASLLKTVKFIMKGAVLSTNEIMILVVGCLVAFLVSLLIVKLLMKYIKKHDFKVFGYYRILLGIVLIILYIIQLV